MTSPLDKYLPYADQATPPPQEGTWTLTAPDGRTFIADMPLKCVRAELNERVPACVALGRIARSLQDLEDGADINAFLPAAPQGAIQAAASSKSTRQDEQGDVPASDTSPKRVDETLNVVHEVGEQTALRAALEADAKRLDFLNSTQGRSWELLRSISYSTLEGYRSWLDRGIAAATYKGAARLDAAIDAVLALQQEPKP